MIRKIAKALRIPNIKQQITIIFLLCSIIPIVLFGTFAIVNARNQMLDQYKSQLETDAIRVNSTLFDVTTTIRISTSNVVNNENYWHLFNQRYGTDSASSYTRLSSYLQTLRSNTAAISSIGLYTNNRSIPDNAFIHVTEDNFASEPWYEQLHSDDYNTWIVAPYTDRFGHVNYELTLVEKFVLKNGLYDTYLVTRLDNNYLRNRLLTNDNLIMASIDDSDVFFSSNRSLIQTKMPQSEEFANQLYHYTGAASVEDSKKLISIVSFIPYQLNNHFYILVSDLNAYKNINQITAIYMVILLFATIGPAFLILFYSSYFSNRIHTLRHAMHQASLGDYNIIDSFRGDDELTDTFNDLKSTVEQIHEKEAKYYETEISRQQLVNTQQQMEFKMLASQINPHFLYNTLETIRMQAIACDNRDVANSINLLGKTMHYVLENTGTDSTTIARELNHVITYLQIQRLRFGDRVNYEIHIPPYLNLEHFHILPLLLQPIVENAIIHGLEGVTNNGRISINFILEEPNLYITIEDNGDGMDEQAVEQLKQHIHQTDTKPKSSIGLHNIDQRLRLLYGEAYGLTIESELHHGTTLTLTLPLSQIIDEESLSDILKMREEYLEQDIDEDE